MRPDSEMATWSPTEQPRRPRLSTTLAEFAAFAALMGVIVAWLVVAP